MNHKVVSVLLAVSVTLNALFAAFVVTALSRKTASVAFAAAGSEYSTGACIVSVPKGGKGVTFGPVEFTLIPGETAVLQFSAVLDGKQLNMSTEPLYDRSVLSVEPSPYGLSIKALAPGVTVLQTVTTDGIHDIARVSVVVPQLVYKPNKHGSPQVKTN